jgi:hypothetical protein
VKELLREYAAAQTDVHRRHVIGLIRRAGGKEVVKRVCEVEDAGARWAVPSVLYELQRRKVRVARTTARELLRSDDGLVVYNTCELIRLAGWVDSLVPELALIAQTHRDGNATLGAMNALREARSRGAHDAMLKLARGRWRLRWPRGRVIEAIARNVRPAARPVLEATFASRRANEYERLAAAAGLARLRDADALTYVKTAARSGLDPALRVLAHGLLALIAGRRPKVPPHAFMGRVGRQANGTPTP